jgi:hypothetical protein
MRGQEAGRSGIGAPCPLALVPAKVSSPNRLRIPAMSLGHSEIMSLVVPT